MLTSFPRKVDKLRTVDQLIATIGDGEMLGDSPTGLLVETVGSPENASQGSLIFINRTGAELVRVIEASKASFAVIGEHPTHQISLAKTLIVTRDPLAWFIRALAELFEHRVSVGVSDKADVSPDATIGENVSIGAGTVVADGVYIGSNTVIGSNVYIGPDSYISNEVFIQNNVSIGSVGLGYHTDTNGETHFFPHLGRVFLGNKVVVGAGCVIVRGQLTDTVIESSVRLGNLVNIGHNVRVDTGTVISSNSCVAGGAHIGRDCQISAGVTINEKIKVGDCVLIGLGSVVTKNLSDNLRYFGNPAKPLPTMMRK